MTTIPTPDTDCPICEIRAEQRTCDDCGLTMTITDCGHYQQPRPIAASQHRGHGDTCAACERVRDAAPYAVGDRVCGGQTHDDYDEGRVVAVVGEQVTVAWDSLVQTTQVASLLRAI